MAAGKIFDTTLWELSISATGTLTNNGDDTPSTNFRSAIFTRYSGLGGTSLGIRLSISTVYSNNAFDGHSVRLEIPDLSIDETFSVVEAVSNPNQSARVEIENLKVYVVQGFFGKSYYVEFDEVRLYWNGTLEYTHNPVVGLVGTLCTPTSIPLFGEPATLTGACGPPIPIWANWATSPVTLDYEISGGMTTTGGWRFKDADGNWVDFPVRKPRNPGITPGSPFTPTFGSATASSTSNGAVASSFSYVNYGTSEGPFECAECPPGQTLLSPGSYTLDRAYGSYDYKDGSIMLLPACERRISRINSDYMAVWWRGGLPYVDSISISDWETADRPRVCDDVVEDSNLSVESLRLLKEIAGQHGTVTNVAHAIEDALLAVPWAPYSEGHKRREYQMTVYNSIPGICDDPNQIPHGSTFCCVESPHYNHKASYTRSYPSVGGRPASGFLALTSDDPTTKYVNFWGAPHWNYFYEFPHDDDPFHWWAQGAKRSSLTYWIPFRSQWADGLFLPVADKRRTRNHLISPPLQTGALVDHWYDNFMGVPTSPVGICRFDVLGHEYPEEIELDATSEPNWSGTDCTLAFTSTIDVTPSASPCVIELDLSSFTDPPYFGAIPAAQLIFDDSGANITSVTAELVNAAGDVLGLVGAARPKGLDADSEWAGSHTQDFADSIIDDEGVDIEPDGEGVTCMTSPERVHDFQYLGGREATTLRLTVENTGNFSIDYPRFTPYPLNAKVYYESGISAAQLFGRLTSTVRWGAGFRWGQWNFWDDIAEELRDTPIVRPMGETPTVLDWLCYRNLLNGVAHDDDLTTHIQSLYDALEGDTEEDAATNRHAFIRALPALVTGGQPGAGVLVNSWREVPPVPAFPHAGWNFDRHERTGHAMISYSFAQESRYYIHPNKPLHYEYDYGSGRERFTATLSDVPDGWFVASHKRPITGDEYPANGYLVTDEPSIDWANHAPYHGVFVITSPGQDEHSGPWNMVDFQGRYHVAASGTDEIIYRRARQSSPQPSWDVIVQAVSETNARNPRMVQDPKTLRVILVYESDEGCREIYSDSDGRTWAAPSDMAITGDPVSPTIALGDGGIIRAAVVPGTPNVIGATWQGPGDQSQSAQFTFKDSAAADLEVVEGQFHLVHSGEINDRWILEVVIDGESSSSSWWSADNCRTWTRFA